MKLLINALFCIFCFSVSANDAVESSSEVNVVKTVLTLNKAVSKSILSTLESNSMTGQVSCIIEQGSSCDVCDDIIEIPVCTIEVFE